MLQFGRALSGAETSITSRTADTSVTLQFGRALSGAETPPRVEGHVEAVGGFNSAAPSQARRRAVDCIVDAGESTLQFGRALSGAETVALTIRRGCLVLLQFGRALSGAET